VVFTCTFAVKTLWRYPNLFIIIIIIIIILTPVFSSKGMKNNYAMQHKKVQKSSWNEPSQNSHALRWHCIAESKRRVAEIKS